ncbi:MAG: hypothetical protein J6S41_07770 [Clostridia bacterium]|nr:hypothetical protein [Clostridia bacterium]
MRDNEKKWSDPGLVFEEYRKGIAFKQAIGTKGLYEQNRINERFYAGDQWHGARCGSDRPLVRYNVIKRIGEYKQAIIGASPVAINYSVDGVPNTVDIKSRVKAMREKASRGVLESLSDIGTLSFERDVPSDEEVNLVMSAMSDYFRVTAEREQFEDKKEKVLRNAYCSGTGVLYTYWDSRIKTGLYAADDRQTALKGDIRCEVLDIENVYFGDPQVDDVQEQPFIILAQRKRVSELRRAAKADGRTEEEIAKIQPDTETGHMAGEQYDDETVGERKATVLTKLYKEWDEDGGSFVIKAVRVTHNVTVREEWDIGIRLYPLSVFSWERRRNCAYGDSEVTYLIPNQIAINRMITASVWAVMIMGMPIMVVNGDVVTGPVTNDPGQILKVYGDTNDVQTAVRYVNPPQFSPRFSENVESMIAQTLTQSGANDAALGDVRPDNTSAIIAVREAATMPLQVMQNRFYKFIEDTARIWAEFWVCHYGKRALKVEDETGTWYMPFDGTRYKDMLISVRTDVGASSLWSEAQSIQTLDNLFERGVINVIQYLKRLPKGTVPNVTTLITELEATNTAAAEASAPTQPPTPAPSSGGGGVQGMSIEDVLMELEPEELQKLEQMDGNVKSSLLRGALGAAGNAPSASPVGQVL